MNVLGICLSPGKGGLELYAQRAIHALARAGHNCHFLCRPGSDLYDRDWQVPRLELRPRWRALPLLAARRLARMIDQLQIDILHMHWNKDLVLVVLAKLLSRRKPKLVYSRHMEITRSKKDVYHRLLYRQVDLMLVIARFVEQQARRFLPLADGQIQLLYLGVPSTVPATPEECTQLLPAFFLQGSVMRIGLIGRIEYYKGQHVLIEALAILARQNLHPRAALIGPVMDESYYAKLLQQIRDSGLSQNVACLGETRQTQKLMSCCDVVVLTTYCETFGLVLAEAMRVGAAVVGTNAGGVPEIIRHGETGMLFRPGDAGELAQRLVELMRDTKLRRRLADAGKDYADASFDEVRHFNELARILEGQAAGA